MGDASVAAADKEKQVERMGLTPDWIIQATAFKVFQLPPPTPEQPFIRGLLDPCTNSLLAPNIPAEKLYDKVASTCRVHAVCTLCACCVHAVRMLCACCVHAMACHTTKPGCWLYTMCEKWTRSCVNAPCNGSIFEVQQMTH